MTNKNLSRKLCEICGIKPREVEETVTYFNENGYLYEHLKDEDYIKLRFPNFTQPENFIKLLKIANDVLGSVNFATAYTKNTLNLFEEQAIMHYIPIAKLNDSFKQAIKSEVWKYD